MRVVNVVTRAMLLLAQLCRTNGFVPFGKMIQQRSKQILPFRNCKHPLPKCFSYRPFQDSHSILFASKTASSVDFQTLFQEQIAQFSKKQKTWKRFGHLVDLAMTASVEGNCSSICDVGTDHGLLATSLALSGYFEQVLGIDVSELALRNGAITLLARIKEKRAEQEETNTGTSGDIPLQFRLGDGLTVLDSGEADALVIAGMGVNTMLQILKSKFVDDQLDVDRIGTKQLLLQPTNTKPKNLILLYTELQNSGWQIQEERIEEISARWYISVSFVRTPHITEQRSEGACTMTLPGQMLRTIPKDDVMYETFQDYRLHHIKWITNDQAAGFTTSEEEKEWLAIFSER